MDILLGSRLIQSLLSIVIICVLNRVVLKRLKAKHGESRGEHLFLLNLIEKSTAFIIVIVLAIIWFSELRNFALSIAAFVVAIVIVTREYIQCILGAIYLSISRVFTIGDWVEVEGKVGEVVKSDWITTTLFEIDAQSNYQYTGRTLTIPNNVFVTHPVNNLNFMRRYISHTFKMVTEPQPYDVLAVKQHMVERANFYCSEFKDIAGRYNALIENRLGVSINGPEASVRFLTSDIGKYIFMVSIFCPTDKAVEIEQLIFDDFIKLKQSLPLNAPTEGERHV